MGETKRGLMVMFDREGQTSVNPQRSTRPQFTMAASQVAVKHRLLNSFFVLLALCQPASAPATLT